MTRHGGRRVRNRERKALGLVRLAVEIPALNRDRVKQIAEARSLSMAECVNEMIEADWRRRERLAAKQAEEQRANGSD